METRERIGPVTTDSKGVCGTWEERDKMVW